METLWRRYPKGFVKHRENILGMNVNVVASSYSEIIDNELNEIKIKSVGIQLGYIRAGISLSQVFWVILVFS